jgi:hypothetical protein
LPGRERTARSSGSSRTGRRACISRPRLRSSSRWAWPRTGRSTPGRAARASFTGYRPRAAQRSSTIFTGKTCTPSRSVPRAPCTRSPTTNPRVPPARAPKRRPRTARPVGARHPAPWRRRGRSPARGPCGASMRRGARSG